MSNLRRISLAALALLALGLSLASSAQTPSDSVGQQLRQIFLSTAAKDVGLSPSAEFPQVFGVALDWPIGEHVATVLSLSDGTASLYTTSTFGIIGGKDHEAVRLAAKRFVSVAHRYLAQSTPTSPNSPPTPNEVRFYLLTYDGLRVIRAPASSYSETAPTALLFNAAQEVVTQLRMITDKPKH